MVDTFTSIFGVDKETVLEAKKRQIQFNSEFTPEHSGLADDGRPLTQQETMRGGGKVVDDLEIQRQAIEEEVSPFSVDRHIVELRRQAARELAQENQKESEKQAKVDEREAKKADREEKAEQKAAKPVKIVADKTDDKSAI